MVEYDRTGKVPMSTKSAGSQFNASSIAYVQPRNYNIAVPIYGAGRAVCLSPNRQALPCKEFLLQGDIANPSYISVGFQATNLVNGLQLIGGQGWIFSVVGFGSGGRIVATPTNWAQGLETLKQNILMDDSGPNGQKLMLNIADFWAAGAGGVTQNAIIFYFMIPGVNS